MLESVAVEGYGVAAVCCAHLLRKRGVRVSLRHPVRAAFGPTLLINPATLRLLGDVFGIGDELVSDLPLVRRRIVLWGPSSEPAVLPHFGVVVNELALLERLWQEVAGESSTDSAEWSIVSGSGAAPGISQHFGSRTAIAAPVELRAADSDTCWVESVNGGWLFLIPSGEGGGSLLVTGDTPDALLAESRLIAGQVRAVAGPGRTFPGSPRILYPLCAPGWLACGSCAMGFDPICGEGAGNAIREAILASAVIGALRENPADFNPLTHYSSRLLIGFLRHLKACRQFYATAQPGEWWKAQVADLDRGIEWTQTRLIGSPAPHYRLNGFELEQLAQPMPGLH